MDYSFWDKYGKALVAFLFAVWTVVSPTWFGDHHIDADEGIIIALAIVNNVVVWVVPLNPAFKGIKTIANALLASLAIAQTVIIGGITPDEWPLIIGAGVAVLGVWIAPAVSAPKATTPVVVGTGFTA
jgi:hypothetical protein